jgi:hypothetical protein
VQAFDEAMREFESLDGRVKGARDEGVEDVYGVWYRRHLAEVDALAEERRRAEGSAAARAAWLRSVVRETRRLVSQPLPRAPAGAERPGAPDAAGAAAGAGGAAAAGPGLPPAWHGGDAVVALHRAELDAMLQAWFAAGRAAGRAELAQ